MTFNKNQMITLDIVDVSHEGEGIGKVDGFTFFVKDVIPGDRITARVMKTKKTYGYARLETLLEASADRTEPVCPYYRACGGCQLQTMRYDRQLAFKQSKVYNNLLRIGAVPAELLDGTMEPVVGMEEPLHYRNKAQYPVGTDKNGEIITGFYAGRTHSIIANTQCYLGVKENQDILERILAYMKAERVSAYDESAGSGLVRHILIRTGFSSGQIMVCLVINMSKEAWEKKGAQRLHVPALLETLCTVPGMASISVSFNTRRDNVIMGNEVETLWGASYIEDSLHVRDVAAGFVKTGEKLDFHISPLSFYQVNPNQTEKLYSIALDYAGLTGKEAVWDLYCGIGTISLFLSRHAGKVYGVEIIPQAIEDAKANAVRNGIENAEFFVGKAEEVLPEFYEKLTKRQKNDTGVNSESDSLENDMLHPDVIVVDPPRKGCDTACLDTMLKMQPERIVYVSCDSATLARDVKYLHEGGYELKKWRAVDQFGMTVHVETVCLLSKLQNRQHIEIELDMDELDLTDAEKKATYPEIKEYVMEHYGYKIPSLYIAQVKQKCDIIERENYNKSKYEHPRQAKCPPEKEAAIMEALQHFGMV